MLPFFLQIFQKFEHDRLWLDNFLMDITSTSGDNSDEKTILRNDLSKKTGCIVDTFRYFYPNQPGAFTCWCTMTGARATNYGERLDYILADAALTIQCCEDCVLLPDVMGSDHCPVLATFHCQPLTADKCPPSCTKYWPEFIGKQKKMLDFFGKNVIGSSKVGKLKVCNKATTDVPTVKDSASTRGTIKRHAASLLMDNSVPKKRKNSNSVNQTKLSEFFSNPIIKSSGRAQPSGQGQLQSFRSLSLSSASRLNVSDSDHCERSRMLPLNNSTVNKQASVSSTWKSLLHGPGKAPLCQGHKEPCVLRTVKKDGPNQGRQFYVCDRPQGTKTNIAARCQHFEWVNQKLS